MSTSQVDQFFTRLSSIVLKVSAAGMAVMTGIIGWQVFARFVLNASPTWTESTALLLMLWYILLSAAIGVREGFHLGVRVILDNVRPRLRGFLLRLIDALVGLFGVAMMVNGAKLASFTASHVIPTLGISRSVAYWPFVVSGFLILSFSIERILTGALEPGRAASSNS